ncbi:hypothetical protein PC129_g6351 [Phytophthora cactorum]|uniref:Uncharacterized protein n=1 Tax=Phytophthora cactorum TaxID=29920 RepID=A0A8T0ZG10_9STRA|nr:hypothetical protein Pcac1_g13808 [Phytophthora cactorum]KAG2831447.1 hypothetical protein PC112_g7266 [Phytophthora cactorum]KAG2835457.1 hypothetical protein PC111_g5415 [Phytophthora cactorum]KAG2861121.1 hypothetical protein PC113_g7429 [Phytophthora cactorum]KAG2909928.1 hypothetical protein PC114_g9939 [Phytophthora cactorum]
MRLNVAGAYFCPCGIAIHYQSMPLGVLTAVTSLHLIKIWSDPSVKSMAL